MSELPTCVQTGFRGQSMLYTNCGSLMRLFLYWHCFSQPVIA